VKTTDPGLVAQRIHELGDLSESLLNSLRLETFGYAVRAEFELVVVRGSLTAEPRPQITLQFEAVESMTLVGGLTARMVEHPEEINWGLSEVSLVRITPEESGVHAEIRWERERRIEITCARVTLEASGAEEAST
jgi:hypothetical protein